MARKLPLSPDISYMLGIYRCNGSARNILLTTSDEKMIERFVKIAVMELDTRNEAISITKDGEIIKAEINNSKLKKLLDKALDERDRIFKYKNEYSGSYFAALFDCKGATDKRGAFLRGINAYDKILLERIGFHTATNTGKCYVRKSTDFVMFIAPFSIKAQAIHR
jgi:hypothetical protein